MPRRGVAGFSARRFRNATMAAGMQPADLARETGIGTPDISKYRNGEASPQPSRLVTLARALGVGPGELLDDGTSDQLARLRAIAGLTQAELSRRAGIGLKRYEAAETGRRPLTGDAVIRVARAL